MRHSSVQEASIPPLDRAQLAERDIDDLLEQLRDLSARICGALRPQDDATEDDPKLYGLAAKILRLRRDRSKLLGGEVFGEPAWDILLELYVAEGSGRPLSISGACYVSGVPTSTALRWIGRLETDGWIKRLGDARDRRRSWLALSEATGKNIFEYLRLVSTGLR